MCLIAVSIFLSRQRPACRRPRAIFHAVNHGFSIIFAYEFDFFLSSSAFSSASFTIC
jgi:hypothetical protein